MALRRFAASLLAGLALLGATLAWWAFATSLTVFNAEGSERVADVLVDQPAVRDALARALTKTLQSGLDAAEQIPAAEIDRVAGRVLDDPRTVAVVHTAVAGAHQRLVGLGDGPVQLDMSAVAQAGRDALIDSYPTLAASLPASLPETSLTLRLPVDNVPALAPVRANLGRAGWGGGLVAVLFLTAAFFLTPDRPGVVRRIGRWGVRVGLASVATGWLVPSLLSRTGNPQLTLIGGLAAAVGGRIVIPALALVAMGIGATIAARAWRTATPVPAAAPEAAALSPAEASVPPVAAWDPAA